MLTSSSATATAPLLGEATPAIVWQANASTLAFQSAGGAVEEILGYRASHWLDAPHFFSERIHAGDRSEVMGLYRGVLESGGEASAEFRAVQASGEPVWCRETISVPSASSPNRAVTGVLTRIGERRSLEALSRKAERIEALRELSARLAHELNNPLMIVTGYAEEVLSALPAAHPLRSDLDQILSAAARITALARDLVNFTRSAARAPERIALGPLLAGLEPRLRQAVGESASVEVAASAAVVRADPGQLEDVILALASAAIGKPALAGRLTVTCGSTVVSERLERATLQPGTYTRIEIRSAGSAGAAVSPSATPAAFESFLAPKTAGKALGPALTRAYLNVRDWGGDIESSAGPDHGAVFVVTLPSAEAADPLSPSAEAPAVLLVEDEPGIRSLVFKTLSREGYRVLEAASGEEALATAAAHSGRIDLLLSDVGLPGMSGRDLAARLVGERPEIRVIYASGHTCDEGLRAGAFPRGSKFLQKPFTLDALRGTLREALHGS